ncbi:MAG: low-specificity L-threonine aldolase [Rhodospirillales bacterium]
MYAAMTDRRNSDAVADLRSDTVTRPSPGMRAAMAEAAVGDDVYGEDPMLNALEETAAGLLGKEAGCFFASGTQSNLAALLSHCGRGEEYISGADYHVFADEAAGAAVLGGISPHPLPLEPDGSLSAERVSAAIKPDDSHFAISRLVSLENSVSGRVLPLDAIRAPAQVARRAGMAVHLDGARLFNATTVLGIAPAILGAEVDSVSLCLSKGLGAPVGSVLVGERDFIAKARRNRKMLGGGMRQAGILAAAGLYALENNIARLGDDHARARRLGEALHAIPTLDVDLDWVQSNMVFVTPRPEDHAPLCAFLAERGIVLGGQVPTIRLVVHLDIEDAGLEAAIEGFRAYYA